MLIPITGSSILTMRGKGLNGKTRVSWKHTNIKDPKGFLADLGFKVPWMLDGYCTIVVSPSCRGDMITLYDIHGVNVHYAEPRLRLNRLTLEGKMTSMSSYTPGNINLDSRPNLRRKVARYPKPWLNTKEPFTLVQAAWEFHYGVKVNKFLNVSINDAFECITPTKTYKLKSEMYHEAFMEALDK